MRAAHGAKTGNNQSPEWLFSQLCTHLTLYVYISWSISLKAEELSSFSSFCSSGLLSVQQDLKAVAQHEIWLQYVPALLFCPSKHKSHIVKVSLNIQQDLITASVKQQQCNANVMS